MSDGPARIPADRPLEEIMDLLVDQARLPKTLPDGRKIIYRIVHKKTNRILDPGLSFVDQGVSGHDQLVFQRVGPR